VAEARHEHRIVDLSSDGVALAGDQRRGDGAGISREGAANPGINRVAEGSHRGGVTQPQARPSRRLGAPDLAGDEADCADLLEVEVPREIVTTRP
jgi:hypothetical protein